MFTNMFFFNNFFRKIRSTKIDSEKFLECNYAYFDIYKWVYARKKFFRRKLIVNIKIFKKFFFTLMSI